MKLFAVLLLVAVVSLTLSSALWIRATSAVTRAPAWGAATVDAFEKNDKPTSEVDLEARYSARRELLDPKSALPTWHTYDRVEAIRAHAATQACPSTKADPILDPSLEKAVEWHTRTCAPGSPPPDDLVDHAPFMHPSGRSYAMLGLTLEGGSKSSWAQLHARAFHVLELKEVDPSALDADERALSALPEHAWEALARGDDLVLTPRSLVVAERDPLGRLTRLRIHTRSSWEAFALDASIALRARSKETLCARPASPDLCWEGLSAAERHAPLWFAWTIGSAGLLAAMSLALGLVFVRERRQKHRDRIHVLRTLTHELRTPATSLRVDIEPLRAAYDAIPQDCQEPLLRISDGIERLHRVLQRSARYMALFETEKSPTALVNRCEVPSTRAMFEDFAEEWPEGVSLRSGTEDGPMTTDPDWLGVAVRNLVENATRHGKPPVSVTWSLSKKALVVRVSDGGSSPRFSLARSIAPYDRDPKSTGLGLGLAIVDRIARLIGGRLTHEASPTTFELRLPNDGGVS